MNLEQRLTSINSNLGTIGDGKVDLCLMLHETKAAIYWKDTKYETWRAFCDKEVSLSYSAVYVYLRTAKLAKDNSFSASDMKYVVSTIGWERLRIGLSKLIPGEPINVATFIKKFKGINLNERVKYEDNESGLVDFQFHLPQSAADTLTNELLTHGMRMTNKSRTNMSAAMVKMIKALIEE